MTRAGKEERRHDSLRRKGSGGERITHSPIIPLGLHPLGGPLSAVSTLSVPLICNVNPRTEDLAPRVCILRRFSFSSREEEKESGMGITSTICLKYAV